MNTKYYMMAALFVLALSCSKEMDMMESVPQPTLSSELVPITFTVDAQSAKTALGASNGVVWSDGDQVSVFDDVIGNTGSYEVKEGRVAASVSETATSVFALYPSSTEASLSGSVITTEIPVVQTAVAGSFGQGANLAVARTTPADAHFVFRNVGGLLKFTLQEEGVTKVVVKANGGEKIAGAVSVTLNADGTIASASCTGSSTVTLQPESGTLTKGATYYIVVAPGTLSGGVSVLLERENQKNPLCRKGSSQLDITSSVIKSLGTVTEAQFDDLYTAYQEMDATLYIAGEAYSKATKGESELLTADVEKYNLRAKFNNVEQGKVFFLEANDGCTFDIPSVGNLKADFVWISRYATRPVTLRPTVCSKLIKGSLVMRNLVIDMVNIDGVANNTGYLFNNSNATADYDALTIDNCSIQNIKKPILYCNVSGYGIKNIQVWYNTLQVVNTGNTQIFTFYQSTVLDHYKKLVFKDNVVFNATCSTIQLFNYDQSVTQSGTNWETVFFVQNNIFYNCPSSNGLIKFYQVASLKINNNIFWAADTWANHSYTFILYAPDQSASVLDTAGNIGYGTDGKNWTLAHSNSTVKASPNQIPKAPTDPFEFFNPATGAYTLKEAYKSYGPQK